MRATWRYLSITVAMVALWLWAYLSGRKSGASDRAADDAADHVGDVDANAAKEVQDAHGKPPADVFNSLGKPR